MQVTKRVTDGSNHASARCNPFSCDPACAGCSSLLENRNDYTDKRIKLSSLDPATCLSCSAPVSVCRFTAFSRWQFLFAGNADHSIGCSPWAIEHSALPTTNNFLDQNFALDGD